MKRELTLADIAGYLPYDLKVQDRDQDIWVLCQLGNADPCMDGDIGLTTDDGGYLQYDYLDDILPVLRPMSDLYVEITERGYNEGKPFVPVKRLGELLGSDYEDCLILDCRIKYSPSEVWYSDMCAFFDLFHRLRFDYRDLIGAGLAVSVHDLKQNPYE
jgi:hypothetical protein